MMSSWSSPPFPFELLCIGVFDDSLLDFGLCVTEEDIKERGYGNMSVQGLVENILRGRILLYGLYLCGDRNILLCEL